MTAAAVRYRPELQPHRNVPTPRRGAAPRAAPVLIGKEAKQRRRPREPGFVERVFDAWLATAKAGDEFAYHHGSLANDRLHDRALGAFADRLQTLSDARFDITSACGHSRGEIIGSGQLQLFARRVQGEARYFCRKR